MTLAVPGATGFVALAQRRCHQACEDVSTALRHLDSGALTDARLRALPNCDCGASRFAGCGPEPANGSVRGLLVGSGNLSVAGVPVVGPRGLKKLVQQEGPLDAQTRQQIHSHLAERLPSMT